ncbi:acyl-CoA dehydrogenase [uncultured Ferrovibrio sp.]|jgi:Acyl-CoA dehydrogenases|uniref:acyl-CoA dehydrogenase n=1 Tax=uncultured Ferrovibrio sp. TaxID=1576913 RepID=UPI0026039E7F|nr:acyl-CoA dehydrogenase [uncultured Ferrovibrio sp.]
MSEQNPVYASVQHALEAISPLRCGGKLPPEAAWLELWPALEQDGFTLPSVPADLGGSDGGWEEELAVVEASAAMAAALPLPETAAVGALLAQAGAAIPPGPLTFAAPNQCKELSLSDGALSGIVRHLPWGRHAGHALLPLRDGVALVALAGGSVTRAANLAGHPRDMVVFEQLRPLAMLPGVFSDLLWLRGAAMRSAQIVAGASKALELAIEYSRTRVQFGRPLAGFQAVQHQIADAASKLAAARLAVQAAYDRLGAGEPSEMAVATARINACLAGAACAGVAHQVHGAIGYTWEYDLRLHTTAIQAWRAEFGSLRYWSGRLGELVAKDEAADLWHMITG